MFIVRKGFQEENYFRLGLQSYEDEKSLQHFLRGDTRIDRGADVLRLLVLTFLPATV